MTRELVLPLSSWPESHIMAATDIAEKIIPLKHVIALSGSSYKEEGHEFFSPHFVIDSDDVDLSIHAIKIALTAARKFRIKECVPSAIDSTAEVTVRQSRLDAGHVVLFERKKYEDSLAK